jgi:hypothetical protein
MRAQKSRWSRLWAAAVFALAGAACSSEHLGMNPQGSGGDGSGPCPGSTLCPPLGTGGIVGTGGIKGAGGSGGTVLDAGSICDQIASKYQTALAVARACTPGAANQCQALVGDAPANCPGSECVDELLVNDGSLVESERENWLNAGCGGPPQLCIDITCRLPPAVCVAVPGSTMGTCLPAPSDAGAGPDAAESCEQLGADYPGGGERRADLHAGRTQPVPGAGRPGAGALRRRLPAARARQRCDRGERSPHALGCEVRDRRLPPDRLPAAPAADRNLCPRRQRRGHRHVRGRSGRDHELKRLARPR